MKILYAADVHGDLRALERFRDFSFTKPDLDVIVVAGELLHSVWKSAEEAEGYIKTSEILKQIKDNNEIDAEILHLAQYILKDKKAPEDIKKVAFTYLNSLELAANNSFKIYSIIKKVFQTFEKPVLTIPGNHDSQIFLKVLDKENLYLDINEQGKASFKSKRKIKSATFAGVGSAPEYPKHLPRELAIPYNLKIKTNERELNSLEGLVHEDPDIMITHTPPFLTCDRSYNGKNVGGIDERICAEEISPNLLLVSHIHEAIGTEYLEKGSEITVVVNSGNLGEHKLGISNTFTEIELDKLNYVKKVVFYKINNILDSQGNKFINEIATFRY